MTGLTPAETAHLMYERDIIIDFPKPDPILKRYDQLGSIPPRARHGPPYLHDTSDIKVRGEKLDKIIWRGRQWAATTFGVERRDGTRAISFEELDYLDNWEIITAKHSIVDHYCKKSWCDIPDLIAAVSVALLWKRSNPD